MRLYGQAVAHMEGVQEEKFALREADRARLEFMRLADELGIENLKMIPMAQ